MPKIAKKEWPVSFRGPLDDMWLSLKKDEAEEQTAHRERLRNVLLQSLQMPNLINLSGSGCSMCAGGPSMADLWKAAVGSPVPEDIAKILSEVGYEQRERDDIEELLSRIEASLHLKENPAHRDFLNASKQVILDKCSSFLGTDGSDAHAKFLHRLAKRRTRDSRLKVFTTNYDLCFEKASSQLGLILIDGFSFTTPRRYNAKNFNYDIVRRHIPGDGSVSLLEGVFVLHKLHGSVNWRRLPEGELVEDPSPPAADACLIYPASGKYQQSYTQPHLESISDYLSSIRNPNTCVLVTGFGFNDDHLSAPLLASMSSNPHMRLIIADPFIDEKLKEENPNAFLSKLNQMRAEGEDIWFIVADFPEVANLIPDLRTFTAEQRLAQSVKAIVNG